MKILMLTPYMPIPSTGGQIRSYNLIKHLSKHHEIHLVAFVKNKEEESQRKELEKFCKKIYICKRSEKLWTPRNVLTSVFGLFPLVVTRNHSTEAVHVIRELLEKEDFDLIHAETFYIMPHIPETDIPILLVEQTIEYKVYQDFVKKIRVPLFRPLFWPDIIKLIYWEKKFWQKADLVGAVSEADEEHMKLLVPNLKTVVLPNAAGEDLLHIYKPNKKAKPVFFYLGNYSWLQNVEGAKILMNDIFPLIRKRIPEAVCIVAGQRAYEKLGKVAGEGIDIVDIPTFGKDAVADLYAKTSIFLAPLEGPGGTRLKILGAMAAGIPVISSATGMRGLEVTNGKEAFIARTPDEFADYAVELLSHPTKYEEMRRSARKLVDSVYSWDIVAKKLEKVYLALLKKNI